MAFTHDVITIGAGSAGLTAAGGLGRFELRVALIERDGMGGECPRRRPTGWQAGAVSPRGRR